MGETESEPALVVRGLEVGVRGGEPIVEDVEMTLAPGEILGVVGESGSGKTTMALALLGFAAEGAEIRGGALAIGGQALTMNESMRPFRGAVISYVPQEPSRSLNPSLRVVAAIRDVIRAHREAGDGGPKVESLLESVGLSHSSAFGRRFPHQLSGGQQQRVAIAMALACVPAVVVLDEPTTGLDVVTQATILDELVRLRDEQQISLVYVTHDLSVVARIADRIAVMYAGRIVEQGPARAILRTPRHPYTRGLLASVPDHMRPRVLHPMPGIAVGVGERPAGCAFAPRCSQATDQCQTGQPPLTGISSSHHARCFHWQNTPPVTSSPRETGQGPVGTDGLSILTVDGLYAGHRSQRESITAASGVSFAVARGECVALVGESGSGKTTIARAIAGLHPIDAGIVLLGGETLPHAVRSRTVAQRRSVQLVPQNPADSLNPRHTVGDAIGRPARLLRGLGKKETPAEVARLLEVVRLPSVVTRRYPREMSGGERQRVAIARALAAEPQILLCDEITSALDVSVQAAILALLGDLRRDFGLSMLFITHDLGVVASVADHVLVLESGQICERGVTADVLRTPQHAYTQRLMEAAPSIASVTTHWDEHEAAAPAGAP